MLLYAKIDLCSFLLLTKQTNKNHKETGKLVLYRSPCIFVQSSLSVFKRWLY